MEGNGQKLFWQTPIGIYTLDKNTQKEMPIVCSWCQRRENSPRTDTFMDVDNQSLPPYVILSQRWGRDGYSEVIELHLKCLNKETLKQLNEPENNFQVAWSHENGIEGKFQVKVI